MRDERKTKAQLLAELAELRDEVARLREPVATSPPSTNATLESDDAGDVAVLDLDDAERVHQLLTLLHAWMVETDASGRVLHVSAGVTDVLGYQAHEFEDADSFTFLMNQDYVPEAAGILRRVIETGEPASWHYRARRKDGTPIWLQTSCARKRAPDGTYHLVSVSRDVNEAMVARAALQASEDRYRAMAEHASDMIVELDEHGCFLFVGANCRDLTGLDPEALVGTKLTDPPLWDGFHPEDRERVREGFEYNIANIDHGRVQFRYLGPDGEWRWLESTQSSYRSKDGIPRSVVITRDATDRLLAERELRESDARYRVLASASRDLITEQDRAGRLVFIGPTFQELLGYAPEEFLGKVGYESLVHPEDLQRCLQAFQTNREGDEPVFVDAYRMRRNDGEYRWFEGAGLTYHTANGELRILGVNRDVTERIEAERERRGLDERIRQSQKLESLGVMAGGIAHDFNNLLTPILGDASLALMDLPPESQLRPRLLKIQKAAHRAAALTNQMLAYSGKGPLLMEPLNLSQLIGEMGQLIESAVAGRAALRFDLSSSLADVEADAAQLIQVCLNLVTNAAEAVGERGGHIEIRTGMVEIDAAARPTLFAGSELRDGAYAFLEVRDDGCGMDSQTSERIFDPFFTTKFTGRGLGLAATLGIVRGHRGGIEIESRPNHGTRFRLLLPAAVRPQVTPGWHFTGTVLVMDHDAGVREFAEETLTRCGAVVLGAAGVEEGLELFAKHAREIQVVLIDGTLPQGAGRETVAALRARRPDVKILLVTGHSEEEARQLFGRDALDGMLLKPFMPAALIEKVRSLVEG